MSDIVKFPIGRLSWEDVISKKAAAFIEKWDTATLEPFDWCTFVKEFGELDKRTADEVMLLRMTTHQRVTPK